MAQYFSDTRSRHRHTRPNVPVPKNTQMRTETFLAQNLEKKKIYYKNMSLLEF